MATKLTSDDFWKALSEGKPLPADLEMLDISDALKHPPSSLEVQCLKQRYAFLILRNPVSKIADRQPRKTITSKSGWLIYDEGDRLLATPGRLRYGGYRVGEEDDEEEGGGVVAPLGNMTHQQIITAQEMIALAIEKGWPQVEYVDGYRPMAIAAMHAAEQQNRSLLGFKLSGTEEAESEKLKEVMRLTL